MIEFGRVGKILAGDDVGKYVKVQELPDDPPSFLVLMAHDQGFLRGCGDYWVEDYESLKGFFSESQWEVEWLECDTREVK
ncbi:hypothetical protein GCM10009654_28140 [Streptomyces hebeiensis]|uniref:Uncharacterized protein n=1 Tax=Streptomyces hebeiensis TaxID=229486 RepID=A0ABN1UXA2_9ACTN